MNIEEFKQDRKTILILMKLAHRHVYDAPSYGMKYKRYADDFERLMALWNGYAGRDLTRAAVIKENEVLRAQIGKDTKLISKLRAKIAKKEGK